MTDQALAMSLLSVQQLEATARRQWETTADIAEKDHALVAMRKAADLMRMLERWISARACRALLREERLTHGGR